MHEDCPDEQLTIGTRSADLAEEFAEALAARVEHFVRMLCNKVCFFFNVLLVVCLRVAFLFVAFCFAFC